MANGIIGTGLSGLRAAQAGLATASHNIANAATPGFSRQQAVQGTAIPQFTGSGYLGRGTETITVRRIFSDFLAGQANAAQAGAAQLETYYREITQIDNLLADPAAGLAPALDDFFRGVDALAADPAHASARQAVLSAAQALAGRFQGLHARLDAVRDGVNRQIESNVAEINAYAQKIAGLNQRIALAIECRRRLRTPAERSSRPTRSAGGRAERAGRHVRREAVRRQLQRVHRQRAGARGRHRRVCAHRAAEPG
ncbi:MAG: flagellar basal body protein [Burkholderiales bacterium]|nr:flagellar basal body protein [Burkholderiales bacterium]